MDYSNSSRANQSRNTPYRAQHTAKPPQHEPISHLPPISTLADLLHAHLSPSPSSSAANVPTSPHHPHATDRSADLLEIRLTLPSTSYLRDGIRNRQGRGRGRGAGFSSVPPDIMETYICRATSDRRTRGAAASAADPDASPWWMAGCVLRHVGDAVEGVVRGWWEEDHGGGGCSPAQAPGSSGSSGPRVAVFASDRFKLEFRVLDRGAAGLDDEGGGRRDGDGERDTCSVSVPSEPPPMYDEMARPLEQEDENPVTIILAPAPAPAPAAAVAAGVVGSPRSRSSKSSGREHNKHDDQDEEEEDVGRSPGKTEARSQVKSRLSSRYLKSISSAKDSETNSVSISRTTTASPTHDWRSASPHSQTGADETHSQISGFAFDYLGRAGAYEEELGRLRAQIGALEARLQEAEARLAAREGESVRLRAELACAVASASAGGRLQKESTVYSGHDRPETQHKSKDDNNSEGEEEGEGEEATRQGTAKPSTYYLHQIETLKRQLRSQKQRHDATTSRLESALEEAYADLRAFGLETKQLRAQLRRATETADELEAQVGEQAREARELGDEVGSLKAALGTEKRVRGELGAECAALRRLVRRERYGGMEVGVLRGLCRSRGVDGGDLEMLEKGELVDSLEWAHENE
ncbi:hypothetical protein F5X98DRAFT_381111 [Xylaria grammica]|nr:hypothetical protein F5X98DRAFT_381111 [Xylaria grammica]